MNRGDYCRNSQSAIHHPQHDFHLLPLKSLHILCRRTAVQCIPPRVRNPTHEQSRKLNRELIHPARNEVWSARMPWWLQLTTLAGNTSNRAHKISKLANRGRRHDARADARGSPRCPRDDARTCRHHARANARGSPICFSRDEFRTATCPPCAFMEHRVAREVDSTSGHRNRKEPIRTGPGGNLNSWYRVCTDFLWTPGPPNSEGLFHV